jgi:hypothetical protein
VDPGERPFALQLLTDAETGLHRLGRLLSGPGGWLLRPRHRSDLAASVAGGLVEVGVARRFHDVLVQAERGVEPGPGFWTAATRVLAELVVMQREPVRIGPMRRRLVEVLAPIWARTPPHALPWPFLDAPPEWTQEQVDHAQWAEWSRKDRLTMHLATLLDRYLPEWYAQERMIDLLAGMLAEAAVESETAGRTDLLDVRERLVVVELGLAALDHLRFWNVNTPPRLGDRIAAARMLLWDLAARDQP